MAMEMPVVSTAVDGVPELVADGETGYLCAMKDAGSLTDRVVEVITNDALRSEFSRKGRERILDHFSFAERVKKMEGYYERFVVAASPCA
jgi:glycosyltransferase involved in cell wall biosynthesis